jgi:hypothetical protein
MRWTEPSRPKNKHKAIHDTTIRKPTSGKYPQHNDQRSSISTRHDMAPLDLESRIAAAFADSAKSEIFPKLIADTEAAAKAATGKAAAAKEEALDPTIVAAEVAAARKEMEDAAFVSDRMTVAATRLRDRFRAVTAAEDNARRLVEYHRVVALRDELAKELGEVYPQLAAKLADLMQRVAANDREIATVKLPDGGSRILESELVARDLQGFVNDGIETLSLVRELRIPAWEHNVHAPYCYIASDNFITAMPPLARLVKV